jgi:hypothetical protein
MPPSIAHGFSREIKHDPDYEHFHRWNWLHPVSVDGAPVQPAP